MYLKMTMNLTLKHKTDIFMALLKSEYFKKSDIISISVVGYPSDCIQFD